MKLSTAIVASLCCLLAGSVYYGIQKRIIIIQLPSYSSQNKSAQEMPMQTKRNVVVHYWSQGAFKQESITILESESKAETLRYIVTNWLTILEQTGLLQKKVGLETVMISQALDAYISFDRSIAAKNESTYDAWMRVEGLLKTIRAANLGISRVNFFVHHQPLVDAHLDFSKSWPIHGFVNAEKN
jgi:hypothetical protein